MCHSVLPSFTMHYDCVNAEASLPWAQCWTASVTWPHSWRICVIFYVKVSTAALADVRCHEVVVRQRSNFTAVLLNTMTGLGENAELSNVTVDVISVLLWSSYQCFFTIFIALVIYLFIIQMHISSCWAILCVCMNSCFQSVIWQNLKSSFIVVNTTWKLQIWYFFLRI